MRITLFIQCYICVFFLALLVTEIYYLNISIVSPQYLTTEYIIKTITTICLIVFVTVCFSIKVFRCSHKTKEKLIFTIPSIILLFSGITGYFTDILSTINRTSILLSLIYFLIFNTQHSLSYPTEQKENPGIANIITVSLMILFTLSMIN